MSFLSWFELNYEFIVGIVIFALSVVSFLVTLFTKRSVSKSIKSFNEVNDLKNKFLTVDSRNRKKQSFESLVDDYVLDQKTNELVLSPLKKDLQEYIDSHIDTALERALQKYLPDNVIDDDNVINDYTSNLSDLSSLAEAIEIAEDYRIRFGLSDNASIADIYSVVDKHAQDLKAKIDLLNKKEEIVNDGEGSKKEVK